MMNKVSTIALLSAFAFGVSGCLGSGSSSGGSSTPPASTPPSAEGADASTGEAAFDQILVEIDDVIASGLFEELTADGQATINQILEVAGLEAASNLPATASYTGTFVAGDEEDDFFGELTGAMTLDVDFDGGSLTGSMSNMLYTEDGSTEVVTGSLDIAGNVDEANIAGNISGSSLATDITGISVTGDMAGQFRGDGATRGAGILDLNAEADEFDSPAEFGGAWVVTKD